MGCHAVIALVVATDGKDRDLPLNGAQGTLVEYPPKCQVRFRSCGRLSQHANKIRHKPERLLRSFEKRA